MDKGPDDRVERDVPEPPFEQLAAILRARIKRSDWAPGRAMASESALATDYGLSRPTVRRSLALLTEEGLIYPVAGRGTYVAERQPGVDSSNVSDDEAL